MIFFIIVKDFLYLSTLKGTVEIMCEDKSILQHGHIPWKFV